MCVVPAILLHSASLHHEVHCGTVVSHPSPFSQTAHPQGMFGVHAHTARASLTEHETSSERQEAQRGQAR